MIVQAWLGRSMVVDQKSTLILFFSRVYISMSCLHACSMGIFSRRLLVVKRELDYLTSACHSTQIPKTIGLDHPSCSCELTETIVSSFRCM